MLGNVREWVEDGYQENYVDAPTIAHARPADTPDAMRVVRGNALNLSAPRTCATCFDTMTTGISLIYKSMAKS